MNELKYDLARAAGVCAVLIGLFCLYLAAGSVQDETRVKQSAQAYLGKLVDRMVESQPEAGQYRRPEARLGSIQLSDSHARVRARIDGRVAVTLLLQKAPRSGRWRVMGVESLDAPEDNAAVSESLACEQGTAEELPVEAELRTAFDGREGIAIQRY